MRKSSAASLYAGDGGARGRPSVSVLDGLRNRLRKDTEKDSAPAADAAPMAPGPAAPTGTGDDKQTLRGLNTRLNGYLDRVKQLQEDNDNLSKQIDEILSKRKDPVGRDWDQVQKHLDDLRQKIKDITMDNAKLLVDSDNAKMANDDLNHKLDDEKNVQKVIKKDLDDMKKIMEEAKLNEETTKKEIKMVMDEIDRLQREHDDVVNTLRDKIKASEVKVEIEHGNNNLSSSLINIRRQYDKLAEKNLKETEDWYKNKFDNIKVEEAQNTEALQAVKAELKEKLKEKQNLEMMIQSLFSTIRNLEGILNNTKMECGQRLGSINQILLNLESEVMRARSQLEHQSNTNKQLVGVKMKLEEEIRKYQELITNMSSGDRSEKA